MKSERRHELQHNTLADWLVKTSETIKPYQNQILAAVTVVLVLIVGYTMWSRNSANTKIQAWNQLQEALDSRDIAKLTRVAEAHPNTTAAEMAALIIADNNFGNGCRQLFVTKSVGQQELDKAIEAYRKIQKESKTSFVTESATFGLARALEARGTQESLKEAVKNYEEVEAKWPNGGCAILAKNRLKQLKTPDFEQLYAYLASDKFDPKPVYSGDSPLKQPLPGLEGFDKQDLPSDAPGGGLFDSSPFNTKPGSGKAEVKPDEKKEKAAENPALPSGETKPAPENTIPEKAEK